MIYAFSHGVEMFCTESKDNCDCYDHVYIMKSGRKYVLDIEGCDCIETVCDIENEAEVRPTYVSRTVFDLIIDGLDKNGFKRCKVDIY